MTKEKETEVKSLAKITPASLKNKELWIKAQHDSSFLKDIPQGEEILESLELLKKTNTNRYTHARQSQLLVVFNMYQKYSNNDWCIPFTNDIEEHQLTVDGRSRSDFLKAITAPLKLLLERFMHRNNNVGGGI